MHTFQSDTNKIFHILPILLVVVNIFLESNFINVVIEISQITGIVEYLFKTL